jgi:hypothetical protein
MIDPIEVRLAKAEALKRFRSAVRLELAIAGDRVIGIHAEKIKDRMDEMITDGGLPALERGMGTWARRVADELIGVLDDQLPELPESTEESNAAE